MAVTAAQREELRGRLLYDTPFWAKHCATVLNEDRIPVRLVARPWQLRFDQALEGQRAAGQPMRAIILKARKLGFSTWVQAKFTQRVTQLDFQYALSVAHLRSSAAVLADMTKLMYERLPTEQELGLGINIRPQMIGEGASRGGSRYMVFGDKLRAVEGSVYESATAGAKGGGRATTPSMVHCSEAAHWEDPEYIVGLLNAVPKRAETIVVIESTAKGFNSFHDRWVRANEGTEDPDFGGTYVPLFFGWQDNPANRMEFPSAEARERFSRTIGDVDGGGDEEELMLVEKPYECSPEQLYWRRLTISEECDGKLEVFHQEHPATEEQAFIGSGTPFFSGVLIDRAMKAAMAAHAPVEGVLRGINWQTRGTKAGTVLVPQKAIWVPAEQMGDEDRAVWGSTHRLRVWEHPTNEETQEGVPQAEKKPDSQHVVFADVAQGEGTMEERDYNAIQVLDHVTQMQVCSYRSRVAIHEYPMLVYLVALYYNTAWLAIEVTGLGVGPTDVLQKDFRYPKMYRRHRSGDDMRQDLRKNLMGWSTDGRTKPLMEVAMGAALKDGTHGLRCVQTARELTTYVTDERGRRGAQKGSFDDLLMPYMGAKRVAAEMPPRDPNKTRTGKVRGFTYD